MSDACLRALWRQLCASLTVESAIAWHAELLRLTNTLATGVRPAVLWRVEPWSPGLGPGSPHVRKPALHAWPRSAKRAAPRGVPRGAWWGILGPPWIVTRPGWYVVPVTDQGEVIPVRRWAAVACRAVPQSLLEFLRSAAVEVRVPSLEPPPPPAPEGPRRARRRRAAETLAAMPRRGPA